jgi:hypothetical protein
VRVQVLSSQLEALQAEVASLKAQSQLSSQEITPESPPPPGEELGAAVAARTTRPALPSAADRTQPASASNAAATAETGNVTWFGYGELNYSRPSDESSEAVADVGRFVLGAGYRFDDRTRFFSELEIEHAIASSEDEGEVEVEQAYIEHAIGASTFAKIGLILIPSGLLNEYHEPTRYYGAFRNLVETAIIPTT